MSAQKDKVSSPFQKKTSSIVFEREKTAWEKSIARIRVYAAQLFLALVPSDDIKQMPPNYMYSFGGILVVMLMGIFVGLFVNGYISSASRKFLAPLIDTITPSSNCQTISVANTGQYRASTSGIWEGQDNFVYSEAVYMIQVTNFEVDYVEYQSIMGSVYESLQSVGQVAKNQSLQINMLYWLTYSAYGGTNNAAQRFELMGNPLVVFNRQQIVGYLGGVNGTCQMTSSNVFDSSNGLLITNFVAASYEQSSVCMSCGPPSDFGYLEGSSGSTFHVSVDVRSLVTCMAVNMGLIPPEALVEIKVFGDYEQYGDLLIYSSTYYDPKYPSMKPLICFSNSTYGFFTCVIRQTPYIYALPLFHHLGNSTEFPQPCDCSQLTEEDLISPYASCNRFSFLAGLLYYTVPFPYNFYNIILLAISFKFNIYDINQAAFNASFVNSYFGQHSPYTETFNSPSYRKAIYDFCVIDGLPCTMMTTTVFDTHQYNWAITEYYFQLAQGACRDTMNIPKENW